MKRLFTFGCSFTGYAWPTWADIVGQSFEYYENWGMSGIGNRLISNKLVECHHLNNITKDDVVLVMFTSIPRIDFYNGSWSMAGNVLTSAHKRPYEELWIEKNWSITQGYYDTWMAVKNVKLLLDNIGCEYKLLKAFNIDPMLPSEYGAILEPTGDEKFLKIYENDIHSYFKIKQPMIEYVQHVNQYYKFNYHTPMKTSNYIDSHPTIKTHEEWCNMYLSEYYTNKVDVVELESFINHSEFKENTINNYTCININHRFGILPS
jgi:hypothetical protein